MAFPACGGDSPSDRVGDFVEKWNDADYSGACELLDADAKSDVQTARLSAVFGESLSEDLSVATEDEDEACASGLEELRDPAQEELEESVEAEVVDEDESDQTAKVELDAEASDWLLTESDGDWLIEEVPLLEHAAANLIQEQADEASQAVDEAVDEAQQQAEEAAQQAQEAIEDTQ